MPITAGLRDWRSQMLPEDIERFEAAAGDLLSELGYARFCATTGSRALHEAAEIRNTFMHDALRLGDWLP
jgi:hypothetical protein